MSTVLLLNLLAHEHCAVAECRWLMIILCSAQLWDLSARLAQVKHVPTLLVKKAWRVLGHAGWVTPAPTQIAVDARRAHAQLRPPDLAQDATSWQLSTLRVQAWTCLTRIASFCAVRRRRGSKQQSQLMKVVPTSRLLTRPSINDISLPVIAIAHRQWLSMRQCQCEG
jgi:hypothetical protein